jgi:hypothetical protein
MWPSRKKQLSSAFQKGGKRSWLFIGHSIIQPINPHFLVDVIDMLKFDLKVLAHLIRSRNSPIGWQSTRVPP